MLPASSALARGRPNYLAPPGNSAISQYLEVVPTAGGPAPPRDGAGPSRALTPAQQRKLGALGGAGHVLASVVAATTPPAASTPQVSSSTSGSDRPSSNQPAAL